MLNLRFLPGTPVLTLTYSLNESAEFRQPCQTPSSRALVSLYPVSRPLPEGWRLRPGRHVPKVGPHPKVIQGHISNEADRQRHTIWYQLQPRLALGRLVGDFLH